MVSKMERIKELEIHSRSMELSFQALPSSSCHAALKSHTQRVTVGRREEGLMRSTHRVEEKDNTATAILLGHSVWFERG